MFETFKSWILKLFGVQPKDTDSGSRIMRAESDYQRIDELNFDAIFGKKLSNIAFADATMEVSDGNGNADSARAAIVREVLDWAFEHANSIMTAACSTGGRLLIPYIHNGHIHCDVVEQERLYVIDMDGERITSAAILADMTKINNDKFFRWVYYSIDNNVLTVQNKVTDETGHEVVPAIVPAWAELVPEYAIGNVERMPWAFIKCPVDNRRIHDVYGAPITYGSGSLVEEIREHMKTIAREYKLTRPMLGLSGDMWKRRPDGSVTIDGMRKTVQDSDDPFIPVDDYGDGTNPPWMIFSPAIRDTAMYARLDKLFELLEKSVGTSKGILTQRESASATATEIRAANHDTFTMVSTIRKIWENAMDDLAYASDVLAEYNSLSPAGARGDYTIEFDWDMSLFESSSETWQQMLDAQAMGAISKAEVRQWLRGGTIEEAQEAIDEIGDNNEAQNGIDNILKGIGNGFTGAGEE